MASAVLKSGGASSSFSKSDSASMMSPQSTACSCRTWATISESPPSDQKGKSPISFSSGGLSKLSKDKIGPMIQFQCLSSTRQSVSSVSKGGFGLPMGWKGLGQSMKGELVVG